MRVVNFILCTDAQTPLEQFCLRKCKSAKLGTIKNQFAFNTMSVAETYRNKRHYLMSVTDSVITLTTI